jgi:hypothetical protein
MLLASTMIYAVTSWPFPGLVGVLAWIGFARQFGMDGPYSALVNVVACGLPMVVRSLLVDKVHRSPSTGIDWSARQPLRETLDLSLTKLAGLWATWTAIAVIYGNGRFFWQRNFAFAMWCFTNTASIRFVASISYVLWIDAGDVAVGGGQRRLLLAREDRGAAFEARSGLPRVFRVDDAQRAGAAVVCEAAGLGEGRPYAFCFHACGQARPPPHPPPGGEGLEARFVVDLRDVATPDAIVAIEQHFGGHLAAADDLAQRV